LYDILICNGRIIDGSATPWFYGDIGIKGDRIAFIGKADGVCARRVIDAYGRVVCPGFIDMHTHSDVMLLANPTHEPKIMQGVTTEVIGVDGLSYAPLSSENIEMMRRYLCGLNGNPDIEWNWNSVSEYLSRFDRQVATNVVYLVPHNALRLETIGFVDREAAADDLKRMQEICARAMKEGAVGFSTGLDYFPCRYSNIEELIAICKTVAEHNGISVWHVRMRDLGLIDAINEVMQVGEATRVKMHFSHYAASGPENKGMSKQILEIIDRAREKGLDVSFDAYPYIASSTTLLILLPRWVHEGGPDEILKRLAAPEERKKICQDLQDHQLGWDKIFINLESTSRNRSYIGKSLLQVAEAAGKDMAEVLCDILLEEELNAGYVNFVGNEEDMRTIIGHPCHVSCSDGLLVGEKPNPRGWGTFPRFLSVYCRDLGLFSLEEIIRHMSAAPAQRLGLTDRGLIKVGLAADLVVFDPETIKDTATFDEPRANPVGVDYVLVNGAITVDRGQHTGILNGRALMKD